ncbi:hypothetical protein GCM10027075_50030 [Streptomyces heilongjiangensis]
MCAGTTTATRWRPRGSAATYAASPPDGRPVPAAPHPCGAACPRAADGEAPAAPARPIRRVLPVNPRYGVCRRGDNRGSGTALGDGTGRDGGSGGGSRAPRSPDPPGYGPPNSAGPYSAPGAPVISAQYRSPYDQCHHSVG